MPVDEGISTHPTPTEHPLGRIGTSALKIKETRLSLTHNRHALAIDPQLVQARTGWSNWWFGQVGVYHTAIPVEGHAYWADTSLLDAETAGEIALSAVVAVASVVGVGETDAVEAQLTWCTAGSRSGVI